MIAVIFLHLLFAGVAGAFHCDRPWPQLEIFLPTCIYKGTKHNRFYELESLFIRPFQLFWPIKVSNVTLTVAYDAEQSLSNHAVSMACSIHDLQHLMPGRARIVLLQPSSYYRRGYDRQQLAMFWADNFTDSEYVGLMDSDATLITFIDREDLFEDGKPVVNARDGYATSKTDPSFQWATGTFDTLGILEPFKTMS